MTLTAGPRPTISKYEISKYFGGEKIDYDFDAAIAALVALTKLPSDDAAVKFILDKLDDARADMRDQACRFGQVIEHWPEVEEYGVGIDNWPDEALAALTGEA